MDLFDIDDAQRMSREQAAAKLHAQAGLAPRAQRPASKRCLPP
jgi:hypothetical protein